MGHFEYKVHALLLSYGLFPHCVSFEIVKLEAQKTSRLSLRKHIEF